VSVKAGWRRAKLCDLGKHGTQPGELVHAQEEREMGTLESRKTNRGCRLPRLATGESKMTRRAKTATSFLTVNY
jgi:hypothetical protein